MISRSTFMWVYPPYLPITAHAVDLTLHIRMSWGFSVVTKKIVETYDLMPSDGSVQKKYV